jgi:hypothetical protein
MVESERAQRIRDDEALVIQRRLTTTLAGAVIHYSPASGRVCVRALAFGGPDAGVWIFTIDIIGWSEEQEAGERVYNEDGLRIR